MKKTAIIAGITLFFAANPFMPGTAAPREILIGSAHADITPGQPAALDGMRDMRISKKITTPIIVTALALESKSGTDSVDQAIFVSCDIVGIRPNVMRLARQKVKEKIPGFNIDKLILNATHTHNAPATTDGSYSLPDSGIIRPAEYAELLTSRIAEAAAESWKKRRAGKAGWGLGHAVIAQNRRVVYADGSAVMYGAVNKPEFRGLEGYSDHNLDALFFSDAAGTLTAMIINLPAPAQETGDRWTLHADLWHLTRIRLKEKFGKDVNIIPWVSAAGDQIPQPMYAKEAEARMMKLRGITRTEEFARRIVSGTEEAYDGAKHDMRSDPVLIHSVKKIVLPMRTVTEQEMMNAEKEAAKYAGKPAEKWNYNWNMNVVKRYQKERTPAKPETYTMELHALRLGDVAIATNEFELFTDYGLQIKAQSPALQTLLIQLSQGSGGYLPTERAVKAGGYSAVIQSSRVGPDGGRILVTETVDAVKQLWKGQTK